MIETYIPLYRKYRPQQFSDLVGQDVVATALGNALSLRKIAHAYLFCGPRGTGKTSSARIFAKSLNCVNGPTATPCQTCPSCVSITQGNALDVTEIDAASNNGVENIRELTEKVQFSPIEGKYKIYIIDEVHMLSNAAFNALLKTLEEPPPNVVFIFATTEPHKVLPTIISRCQRFDFSRITRDQIEARLNHVAQLEGIKISPEAVTLIARHVRGGLRDALGLLDQVSVLGRADADREISQSDVRSFIGILEEDILCDLTQGVIQRDPAQILGQIRFLQERGVEPVQLVKELTQHFRNLLIAKTCGPNAPADTIDVSADMYQRLCRQAEGLAVEEIPQMLNRLSLMEGQLKHSQQPLLWLEVGLLELGYREEIYLVKQLAERVAQLESLVLEGSAPAQAASRKKPAPQAKPAQSVVVQTPVPQAQGGVNQPPQAPKQSEPVQALQPQQQAESPEAIDSSNAHQLWQRIVDAIPHMPTKVLVHDHFRLLGVSDTALTIGYSASTLYETFKRTPDKAEYLEQAVRQVMGKACKLTYQQAGSSGAPAQEGRVSPDSSGKSAPSRPKVDPPVSDSPPLPVPKQDSSPAVSDNTVAQADPVLQPAGAGLVTTDEMEAELQQAKQYTQELLQGRLLE